MDVKDIEHLAVERIFLVPDASGGQLGYLWCDDPAPGMGMVASEAVEYVRKDVHEAVITELEAQVEQHKAAEETQIALRQKAAEREALKQAEAMDRLSQLLQETHFDKAPSVARVVMQVNDAINRVKQEVRPLRLVASADSDPHPNCELECGAYGTYCKCNAEQC